MLTCLSAGQGLGTVSRGAGSKGGCLESVTAQGSPEHLPNTVDINFGCLFYQMSMDGRAICIDWT